MIACYAPGVWAYCALPVLVRGFYALEDRSTPVRIGMLVVVLNLALNLTLVWPLAAPGLAVATSLSAMVQVAFMALAFSRRMTPLAWDKLAGTLLRSALATAVMVSAGYAVVQLVSLPDTLAGRLAEVLLPVVVCVVVYLATAAAMRSGEIGLLRGKFDDS